MALALAQMGSPTRAQEILNRWPRKIRTNRETLSILGRTYKDQWCANPANEHYLRQSFDYYNRAFEIEPPDFYPGINAATVAFLLKETDKAQPDGSDSSGDLPGPTGGLLEDATIAETLVVLGRLPMAQRGVSRGGRGSERQSARILFHPKAGASVIPASPRPRRLLR